MISLIPWISGCLIVAAIYLLSRKRKLGLWFQLISGILNVAFFMLTTPIWGYVVLNTVLIIISVQGIIKWQK
jgi:hypothetical protein